MNEKYVLSVDQGTTGTRSIIFDKEGNVISSAYLEHEQIYPKPGWVEHDPVEILENTLKVIKESMDKAKIDWDNIVTIGVTNQRESIVAWNPNTGTPYYNVIVWQDTRTKDLCERLKNEGLDSMVHEKTGLYLHTYFSATKIRWLLDNISGLREKARNGQVIFGTVDTWLIWNLTGEHVTDYTNASRTMLMNIRDLEWDNELLELFKIPEEALPTIEASSNIYGTLRPKISSKEVPVSGDLGDQQAALVGQAAFERGEVKNTYGTGNFLLMNLGKSLSMSRKGLLSTIAYGFSKRDVSYALEGSIAITGAVIQWLRDNLGLIKSASETEELAKRVSIEGAGGVYFVPAFSGLFAPYWDMDARGLIIGLTRYTRKEHIVHAALEAICYQTRDVIESMESDTGANVLRIKVDGGASVNNYLMQLQANILGKEVIRPKVTETTSLGAAYMAGLAVGYWEDVDELRDKWKIDRTFIPQWSVEKREKLYKGWKEAVSRCKKWLTIIS
ncbi:MAG: glycerol kinase [Thermoprotei archaeon]|nr:MAG: glycerol kinase [Thermoprotei archaeon]